MMSPLQAHLLPLQKLNVDINSNPILRSNIDLMAADLEEKIPRMKFA
jgi:hypothetical protein